MKNPAGTMLILTTLLCLFCGCVPQELMLRYDPKSTAPVRIGLLLPLTGPDADRGKMMLNGARFAAEELNSRKGHCGRQVDLVVIDSSGTAEGVVRAFGEAAAAGVIGVAGIYSTVEARAVAPLARKYRIPTVITMATGNDDVINANPFVYRVVFTDRQQAEMIAAYLKLFRRAERLVILVSADPADIYSRNVARDAGETFRELGGEVVAVEKVDEKAPDAVLRNAAALLPDAVLLPFEGARAARYFKKLRSMGYVGIICGPDTWDDAAFFSTLSGVNHLGNCFYTAFFSPEARHAEFLAFREAFRKKRYYFPGSCEVQAFDAVNMLLIGFGNNGTDLKKFDVNWQHIRKHSGAAGIYTMLPGNAIDRTIYINRVGRVPGDNSKFTPQTITGLQYSRLKDYNVTDDSQ